MKKGDPMDESILAETMGLSPGSYDLCESRIVRRESGVFLDKLCGDGVTSVLLDEDPIVWEQLTFHGAKRPCEVGHYFLKINSDCNMDCDVCFEHDRDMEAVSVAEAKRLTEGISGKLISLTGGEPTLHPDLEGIISALSGKNAIALATNGLRLAEPGYAKRLKRAGLENVVFSLNSMSPDVLAKLNGEDVLEKKLAALKKLRKAGLSVMLSVMLVKGVNEGCIRDIIDFSLKDPGFIREVRIRSMSRIGRFIESERLTMSRMLGIACHAAGIEAHHALAEAALLKKAYGLLGIGNTCHCRMGFHIRQDGTSPGADIPSDIGSWGRFSPRILPAAIKAWGLAPLKLMADMAAGARRRLWYHDGRALKISIRSWPDRDTLDMVENGGCTSRYLGVSGRPPVCLHNIMREACRNGSFISTHN